MLSVLIVDDEPLARAGLSDYVARTDFLTEVGQARNGMEALAFLERRAVDLLLLDVQMPGLSGTELLRALRNPPAVIFTTADPSFAVEGFELAAVDYLLKPIDFGRFLRAVLRARDQRSPPPPPPPENPAPAPPPPPQAPPAEREYIFVREEGRLERIRTADIRYAEAMQNYCRIHTTGRKYLPLLPLGQLLDALPEDRFVLVHRSYLVNLAHVDGMDGNQLRIWDTLLPVSRAKREEVRRRLLGDQLL